MVVAENGFDLRSALHEAVEKLSAEISHERGRDVYAKTADGVQVQIPSKLRNYSFFLSDDQVFFKKNNLDRKKKRCIIYTMGFVYPFDVFKL